MCVRNVKFVALHIRETVGVLIKIGQSHSLGPWICPRCFLPNFLWAFVQMDPMNVPAKFEVRIALPNPEIIGVLSLGASYMSR